LSSTRARRSYYALETRSSNEALRVGGTEFRWKSIQLSAAPYVEGLTGAKWNRRARRRAGRSAPRRRPHDSLPSTVSEFGYEELDFRLYKVLARMRRVRLSLAPTSPTRTICARLIGAERALRSAESDARDAFGLNGYISESGKGVTP